MFPKNAYNLLDLNFSKFAITWEQRKLGEITNIKTGSSDLQDSDDDGEYPFFVRSENIERSNRYIFEGEAILIPGEGRLGDIYHYINGKFDYHQRVYKISDFEDLVTDGKFVLYYLQQNFKRHALKFTVKATVDSLRLPMLLDFEVKLPSLEEQKKISALFYNLDNLITLHQRECDLLVKTKKSYLQKMFPKNGEDKPEIRFAGFTDAWEQREFGELLKEFSIKSKVEDEHTVLSSTNSGMEVRDGRVSGTSNLGYKIIENGDLVLSPQNLWIGNINVNDIGIGLVSPSYKTFKFVSVFGSFIEPQLRMPRLMEKYKNASTQGASVVRRNLELDSFYQITIRVPKSDEQRKIGDFFRQLDDLITLHQRELNSLKNMKKSLLQQMFI